MATHSILELTNGEKIAYHQLEGKEPGVIFLGGFLSDMTGVKAVAFEEFCRKRGQAYLRFDYQGRGESSGEFMDCTLGTWAGNALSVLTQLTTGKQILVGSSMGGWISLLLALDEPERVAGIIGIAAAPDFTEYLIWDKLTKKQQAQLMKAGQLIVPSDSGEPYPITLALIEDGRKHLLLHHESLPIHCPVRLLHGTKDDDVPWEISFSLNEKIASKDIKTILIEGADHRLSEPDDIKKLLRVTEKMIVSLT